MNKPLRFCMVTTFYPPYHFGGDATFIYRLSNVLAEQGHHVEVIHCRDSYNSLKEKGSKLSTSYPSHPNVAVHGLESGVGALSPLWTQQMGSPGFKARRIHDIIDNGRFDVIHFHNISLVGGPKVLEYGDALKIYTMHEYWLVCPTHVLFKFNTHACEKPECLKCTLTYKRPPQAWRYSGMLKKAVKNVDVFISPSQFGVEMHARMGLDIPAVHLPYFVPRPPAPEAALESSLPKSTQPTRQPYFLFVGRTEKLKGLQDVIPVFKERSGADFLIVGNGNYQEELQALADGEERIKFLGALPYQEVVELYKGAIALIVPSLCYETFGQIVAEAFTMRTPVIVNDIGALRESVTLSGGGLLYRDAAELARALDLLQSSPGLRDEMGEKGHAAFLRDWTAERHLEQYFEIIEGLQQKRASLLSNSST